MKPILIVESISKIYNNTENALKNISLEIYENSFVTMIGQSGSGKSTLLNIISGLLKPTKGNVFFKSKDITKFSSNEISNFRRQDIGQIFQNYHLLNNLTVEENIKLGINPYSDNYDINTICEKLSIKAILKKFPSELSGGQQQRVSIARALIKKPTILFCDEATGALDEENSKNVIQLLHDIKKDYGVTIIFITHNHEIAKTSERIITVKNGSIFKDEINTNPILPSEMNWI